MGVGRLFCGLYYVILCVGGGGVKVHEIEVFCVFWNFHISPGPMNPKL